MASRHLARIAAMQSLYDWEFRGETGDINTIADLDAKHFSGNIEEKEFCSNLIKGIVEHKKDLDTVIESYVLTHSVEKINLVDKVILRLGIFELTYENPQEVPPLVAIDEAIELAKDFSDERSKSFVSGVLGSIYQSRKKEEPPAPQGA